MKRLQSVSADLVALDVLCSAATLSVRPHTGASSGERKLSPGGAISLDLREASFGSARLPIFMIIPLTSIRFLS